MASKAALQLILQLNAGIDKEMERLTKIMGAPISEGMALAILGPTSTGGMAANLSALLERSTPYHGQVRK